MIYRKLISNILLALLMPIILGPRLLPNLFNAIFYHNYKYEGYPYPSLKEFLCAIYCGAYLFIVLWSLIIFLPFQLIKDHYHKQGRNLSFIKRIGLLALIVIVFIGVLGTFSNVWLYPLSHNIIYIGIALGFALVFTTLFHFLVDRYEK